MRKPSKIRKDIKKYIKYYKPNWIDPGDPPNMPPGMSKQGGGIGNSSVIQRMNLDKATESQYEKLRYFRQRLKSILKDNMFTRRVSRFRSGKLDHTKLFKVPVGSGKVFTQKSERQDKNYNVLLMLDQSGSMGHLSAYQGKTWLQRSNEMAKFLMQVLDLNKINYAVLAYNHRIIIMKEWDKKMHKDDWEDFIELGRNNCNNYGNCNHDREAWITARQFLKKAPEHEGKNIIFCFTDGGIEYNNEDYNCDTEADNVAALYAKEHKVNPRNAYMVLDKEIKAAYSNNHLIVVAVNDYGVRNFFPDAQVVKTEDDFVKAIISRLSKLIKRI